MSHELPSSHLRVFGWLRLVSSFSAYTGCCVTSQMPCEKLGRHKRKLGMLCFHSWLKESLHWAIGQVLSWSDSIQTILCSCNNKFSSFQVIYFNYSMIPVIDFFFLYTLRPFIAFPVQGRFKMLTSVFRDNKDFRFHPSTLLLNKAVLLQ